MKKWKVFVRFAVLSSALLMVSGCSGGNTKKAAEKKSTAAESSKVELSVEGGTYIIPDGEKVEDSSGFLALDIKVKNKSDDKLDISPEDFALYDEEGNKVSSERVYDSNDKFKVMSYESVSQDKSFTAPLVFEVDKEAEYELHYKPTYYSEDEKDEGIELKLNAKKYSDETKEVEALVEQYISTVFYGDEEKKEDTEKDEEKKDEKEPKVELANDLEKEKQEFKEGSIELLKEDFSRYEPSSAEVEKVITEIQTTNREKAKVTYAFKEFFPETATIYVRPEVILLEKVDTEAIMETFVEENKGKYSDYSSVYRDAEKYLLQELPTKIKEAAIATESNMDGEGYQVKLEKKDGKWEVHSENESRNYDFNSMRSTFRGGLDD
ncbi:hypothetical protein NRIC_36610 [Enterococcus florum]|uniref:DUF4352 domain-containing protein n=1 Tax=Enterococcus florum TaxID=2480627 RepID=A0A4P5PCE7_9ENTE|nr:DUF4352 domain-containing protein [Enterococcus florum]GCF95770.1 hypothetical protein NRIC_36610 [Enterococcus florum]